MGTRDLGNGNVGMGMGGSRNLEAHSRTPLTCRSGNINTHAKLFGRADLMLRWRYRRRQDVRCCLLSQALQTSDTITRTTKVNNDKVKVKAKLPRPTWSKSNQNYTLQSTFNDRCLKCQWSIMAMALNGFLMTKTRSPSVPRKNKAKAEQPWQNYMQYVMSVISPMTFGDVQGHFGLFCIFMVFMFQCMCCWYSLYVSMHVCLFYTTRPTGCLSLPCEWRCDIFFYYIQLTKRNYIHITFT